MSETSLTPELLELIGGRFRALGEPARLRILAELRGGERTVTELMEATGMGQANVSKHLQLLHARGFVGRRREGQHVRYRLADPCVFQLCDIVCGRLETELEDRLEVLSRT